MLNIPDLNKFKVFYQIYLSGSLVRAASALNITRSAVSQSLKALEEDLQIKLFFRDSKKVIPTEYGEQLYRSLEPLFSELESTITQFESGKKVPSGHLRIGAPHEFASNQLTKLISSFRQEHSRISFEIVLGNPILLLGQLTEGKLNLAFIDNADIHADKYPVSVWKAAQEKLVGICSKNYYRQNIQGKTLKFEDLRRFEFIDYLPHGPVIRMWIKHHFKKSPSDLKIALSIDSVRGNINAALQGLGVAVVPEHLVEREIQSGQLFLLPISGKEMINQITLARRLDNKASAAEKIFLEACKAHMGSHK